MWPGRAHVHLRQILTRIPDRAHAGTPNRRMGRRLAAANGTVVHGRRCRWNPLRMGPLCHRLKHDDATFALPTGAHARPRDVAPLPGEAKSQRSSLMSGGSTIRLRSRSAAVPARGRRLHRGERSPGLRGEASRAGSKASVPAELATLRIIEARFERAWLCCRARRR
jgi:hypothetical protein